MTDKDMADKDRLFLERDEAIERQELEEVEYDKRAWSQEVQDAWLRELRDQNKALRTQVESLTNRVAELETRMVSLAKAAQVAIDAYSKTRRLGRRY